MKPTRIILTASFLFAGALFPSDSLATDQNRYGPAFWRQWGDGRAEMAGYDLVTPRYGALRAGVAVTIFVTEPFSNASRVKADPGKHPPSDEFQAMKLNLIRDYPTGLYDYNVMTSAFIGLQPFGSRAAGSTAKISFSAQEWCGHMYDQLLFRDGVIHRSFHSYFDGEADRQETLADPRHGISEDSLFLWARGLAQPFLAPGESRAERMLSSLMESRLKHAPLYWTEAQFSRAPETTTIKVPAGNFRVHKMKVSAQKGKAWTFFVEAENPHRIIQWETSEGETGSLLKSERLAYWEMNSDRFRSSVEKIGLRQRPSRTP